MLYVLIIMSIIYAIKLDRNYSSGGKGTESKIREKL